MIPFFDVYEASVKYEVRETGGDQELYDILLTPEQIEGDVRVFSDVRSDLSHYSRGETVYLAHTPNGPQAYRLLNMPGDTAPLTRQTERKVSLFEHIYRQFSEEMPPGPRQDAATTVYLDQRDRGDDGPLEESEFVSPQPQTGPETISEESPEETGTAPAKDSSPSQSHQNESSS
jgi:hypothetical protein